MENKQLVEVLNKQLANWNVLYTKLHHFHWYVKGENFFTLHEKFEELYNEAAGHIDDIAERILTIGGKPLATLKSYLEVATIEEATTELSATEMVTTLVKDMDILIQDIKGLIKVAEDADDEVTADMFIGVQASLEKHKWMLNSFLG